MLAYDLQRRGVGVVANQTHWYSRTQPLEACLRACVKQRIKVVLLALNQVGRHCHQQPPCKLPVTIVHQSIHELELPIS